MKDISRPGRSEREYDKGFQTLLDLNGESLRVAYGIVNASPRFTLTGELLAECAAMTVRRHKHSDRLSVSGTTVSYRHGDVALECDLVGVAKGDGGR